MRTLDLPKWAMSMSLEMRWHRVKGALATPLMRKLLRRPSHLIVRNELAARYLRGSGIEVGALNAPLTLPPSATVCYVDCAPDVLERNYSAAPERTLPHIVSDIENLAEFADQSLDFVVANHVLEHVENPLRALSAIARVLRKCGIAFIALPDKTYTFDKRRSVTPLSHIIRDYREGPSWSRSSHYLDWAVNVERSRAQNRAKELERSGTNIHFHVWDQAAMREMLNYAASVPEIAMSVEHELPNRGEVIWILRK